MRVSKHHQVPNSAFQSIELDHAVKVQKQQSQKENDEGSFDKFKAMEISIPQRSISPKQSLSPVQ
jgi:hypothetical protein